MRRILTLVLLCQRLYATDLIDNSINGDPEVHCGSESISISFHTSQPFGGKIFVKGYVADSNCIQMGDQRIDQTFAIRFDQCGVRRERRINGVTIASTVIVSFHSIFITKVDRAYRVSCFYMESTRTVNQQIDVSSLTTELLEGESKMPVCKYEILSGGPSGQVAQYARIGDTVYHKWTCETDEPDVYCMRVHSCTVYDGQGGPPVTVLDVNGCEVDKTVLKNLDYMDDLSAGQEALAFKFADRSGLYFNCQIQLTIKDRQYGCTVSQPDCSNDAYEKQQIIVEPSPQSKENSDASEYAASIDVASSVTSGESTQYPTPPSTLRVGSTATEKSRTQNPYFAGRDVPESDGEEYEGHTSRGPPGVRPSYAQIQRFTNRSEQKANATTPSYDGDTGELGDDSYARLIKRELQNRTEIVADFDLPEQGLLVFGLEEQQHNDDGTEIRHDPVQMLSEERNGKTCMTYTRFILLSASVVFVISSLVLVLAVLIVRQRRMLLELPYLNPPEVSRKAFALNLRTTTSPSDDKFP